ncbi:phosphoribosylaminoimidazole carboxylase [Klebsormidium nitens]|uniref:phosphoribosylaminoimidazole carboxylase n=1 Tax=Klebsormidium nitens TaxID=105231 RepID=A0A1Y1I063_KLENI|nr:phosphoribosylaminoimidazole carboxylase [Klebsormidium nitens]|eukprot:GAQ82166.1 phosphoribosylaminoimidazole carboxylase [Klebsormidium nitens]
MTGRGLGRGSNGSAVRCAMSSVDEDETDVCGDLCTTTEGLCNTVVGVLGGGQLGRMLCQAASPMGLKVDVLDPLPEAPASRIAHRHEVGSFKDASAVRIFARGCGVLTVEIEHVDVDTLDALASEGVDVEPRPSTIRIIQDKYLQKEHFAKNEVPLADFVKLDDMDAAIQAGRTFGYPLMIKSRKMAYDGRGNAVAHSVDKLAEAVQVLGGFERGLYAEKWAPFQKELAVMVARGRDGSLRSYPVVETAHKDNICHTVEAPAAIPEATAKAALKVAEKAVGCLYGAGVFGVELFLLPDGEILLNEVAPRPHNSGHYTIEACATSQYEQHLRAVLGLPLGDPAMKTPAAIMLNILGEAEGEAGMAAAHKLLHSAVAVPGASVHWYEKPDVRPQRKIGHITIVGPDRRTVRRRLAEIVQKAGWTGDKVPPLARSASDDTSVTADNGYAESLATAVDELEAPTGEGTSGAGEGSLEGSGSVGVSEQGGASRSESTPREEAGTSYGTPGAQVGIIMGSDSDLPVMSAAAAVLEDFGIPYELTVVSAHRTPDRMFEYAKRAHKRGIRAIIAGAGGAAHLPGMVAALSPLPVFGVPVKGSTLDGMDSLLSIVQMPRGIPVGTLAINNAMNAALQVVRVFGAFDPAVSEKIVAYHKDLERIVLEKAEKLEAVGWKKYLDGQRKQ